MLTSVETRDVVGQAKGILMERYGIGGAAAFALLVRVSRTSNRKLRDVCEELVLTRELAGHPRDVGGLGPTSERPTTTQTARRPSPGA